MLPGCRRGTVPGVIGDIDQHLGAIENTAARLFREQRFITGQRPETVAAHGQHTGIRGVKHKLESFRNKVQGTLQQAGADFYSSGSEMINRFVNRLTGDFEVEVERNLGPKIRDAFGATSQGAFSAYLRKAENKSLRRRTA